MGSTRRPRRGDWAKRLTANLANANSDPSASDSDFYPCDSSCSSDSFSSQDTNQDSNSVAYQYATTATPAPLPKQLQQLQQIQQLQQLNDPQLVMQLSQLSQLPPLPANLRQIPFSDYMHTELPDVAYFFRSIMPPLATASSSSHSPRYSPRQVTTCVSNRLPPTFPVKSSSPTTQPSIKRTISCPSSAIQKQQQLQQPQPQPNLPVPMMRSRSLPSSGMPHPNMKKIPTSTKSIQPSLPSSPTLVRSHSAFSPFPKGPSRKNGDDLVFFTQPTILHEEEQPHAQMIDSEDMERIFIAEKVQRWWNHLFVSVAHHFINVYCR